MKKLLSLVLLLMPLSLMAADATITLMANGQVFKTVNVEVGKTIGDVMDEFGWPDAYPFHIYEGWWAKNATGDPEILPNDEVINGDMTLYYHWMIYKGITKCYLKRVTSREEIENYDYFYLVTADGKHAMVSDSRNDWFQMSINENSYTINGLAMKFGTQKDVNIQGDSIDVMDGENPLSGTLPFYFFERSYDNYSKRYTALGNGIVTYGDNFAYQKGDAEPYFGHLSNRGRDDLGKLGYNFVWNLSFTADGYAKLENEEFGYIYYSETANEDGHNFRLSKTAAPNLVAYRYVQEEGYKFTTSLDYDIIHLNKNIPEGVSCYITSGAGSDGGSFTAAEFYDAQTEKYSKFAVMKGYKLPLFVDYYDQNMYKHEWSISGEGTAKEELYEMHGEERPAYVVTPTGECTVNFNLTEDIKKSYIGGKEVTYSRDEKVDIYGDGSVIVDGSSIILKDANLDGGIKSELLGLDIEVTGNCTVSGGIEVTNDLGFNNWDDEAQKITVYGGIHSSREANGATLSLHNVDLYVYPGSAPAKAKAAFVKESAKSIVSGFAGLDYSAASYTMALPKDGYYDETSYMLCNSDGTPATQMALIKNEHYDDFVTGVKNVQTAPTATRKNIYKGQIVIEKNGSRYNVAGQMLK